jgi:negative regulator of flagellin synthesis FlgM
MSMDIKNLTQTQPRTTGEGRSVAENSAVRSGGSPGGKESGSGGDRVTLSETATRLSDLTRTVSEQPVVDSNRVEQIRQAIQNGSYQVDPQRIADRLTAMEKVL